MAFTLNHQIKENKILYLFSPREKKKTKHKKKKKKKKKHKKSTELTSCWVIINATKETHPFPNMRVLSSPLISFFFILRMIQALR